MNTEEAILYAHQQMRAIGKKPCEYHFETFSASPSVNEESAGYFERRAYNELYILLNPENYYGTLIIADNSVYFSDDYLGSGVHEFTGMVRIIKVDSAWNLTPQVIAGHGANPVMGKIDFLRVVY